MRGGASEVGPDVGSDSQVRGGALDNSLLMQSGSQNEDNILISALSVMEYG